MDDLITELMADRKLMKKAPSESKALGHAAAKAEADYQIAKAKTSLILKAEGMSATLINLIIKGDERVSPYLLARDCARADYDSSRESLNVYKLDARLLEAQIDREYRG